jgi:N-acetylglutamate synthase-like GNAT family acetyltransferase
MEITYKNTLPESKEYFNLFETTGWNKDYQLSEEEVYQAIQNSWYFISAYEGEKLVGFGRMICDGIMHALILDMIVLPDYQGRGIGSAILHHLLQKCKQHKIRDVQLFSAKDKSGFYQKHGFSQRPVNAPGMEIKYKPYKSKKIKTKGANLN